MTSRAIAIDKLKGRNIKLSVQRIGILEYLIDHPDHPTVDEIYSGLISEIPTLSIATVYNTVNMLAEEGLIRKIKIEEEQEARYDPIVEEHGHFKCNECGSLYDFPIHNGISVGRELDGFNVELRTICFYGTCPKCAKGKGQDRRKAKSEEAHRI